MYKFVKFTEDRKNEWDNFVIEKSINGTFLQSRRFINYHAEKKFNDCSLLIYNQKGQLVGVCLANQIRENSKNIFFSHQGTTFGGLIIDNKRYNSKHLFSLIEEFKEYLNLYYDEAIIKQTPDIFSGENNGLFEYVFQYCGFKEHKELSTYVNLELESEMVLRSFSQGKRTNVHNCKKEGLICKEITKEEDIKSFYDLLSKNLKKYNTKPVHSLKELIYFKKEILREECAFYGIFDNSKIVAGSMIFFFNKTKTAHTQYLAQDQAYTSLSPMSYMYYCMIIEMKKKGYEKLSWGIVTENCGDEVNMGLLSSKEDFGSSYTINRTYEIKLK